MADTLNIRYGISLMGLSIGTAGLQVHLGAGAYDMRVDTKLTGLAALVSSAKGAATAAGAYNQSRVAPATYATTSANSQMTRTIRMALNGGNVRAIDIYPPFDDPPDRVPLTEASKRNYWTNTEFDRLWLEARSTMDEAARLKDYNRMMEIMHDEVPSIFLLGLPRISGRNEKVSGWQPSRDSLLRLHKVSVKP